jgi:murein DD-endopeptidase MepM/ murein hydrolase activator NlpD
MIKVKRIVALSLKSFRRLLFSYLLIFLGAGCIAPTQQPPPPADTAVSLITSTSTHTLAPAPTRAAAMPTEEPAPVPTLEICPPLPGYSRQNLLEAISNPYQPPRLGSDDPHQGVDLAVTQDGIALAGNPIQAALVGRVAMILNDRFPYGNAVLIETPLRSLLAPNDDLRLAIPTPAPTLPAHPSLTCPAVKTTGGLSQQNRSLYLLYAHLSETAVLQPGDAVACGEYLGKIGQSGNALNPHLHLEARVGPSGARFSSMAHYTTSASAEEMGNYCLWRVSNQFQLVNPLDLLRLLPD